jgi:hypothetical protein
VTSALGVTPTQTVSASGFSLAAGPGLRLWVHEQIAIGYVALLRISYLAGELGALPATPTEDTTDGSRTQVGFDGAFQILGVF